VLSLSLLVGKYRRWSRWPSRAFRFVPDRFCVQPLDLGAPNAIPCAHLRCPPPLLRSRHEAVLQVWVSPASSHRSGGKHYGASASALAFAGLIAAQFLAVVFVAYGHCKIRSSDARNSHDDVQNSEYLAVFGVTPHHGSQRGG
jgi:hypothetical protein